MQQKHYENFRDHVEDKREYGGLVRISGNFLLDHEDEILNLIKHEDKREEENNSKARVTKIEKVDGGIVVQTSDHNFAMHIGKSLSHAYKGEHEYKFRKGEKFVEVDWQRD